VLIVRATKKLLDRVGPPTLQAGEESTTILGEWYATALFWKPQAVLIVNERTLLPVLMPLAPASTFLSRVAPELATVLATHGTPATIIDAELRQMRDRRIATTANRSVVGIMNEFSYLADVYRATAGPSLLDLSLRLATTPCSPLYKKNISPDRELAALVHSIVV
jgi:hypothetical protein